jgi:hypothetical protein
MKVTNASGGCTISTELNYINFEFREDGVDVTSFNEKYNLFVPKQLDGSLFIDISTKLEENLTASYCFNDHKRVRVVSNTFKCGEDLHLALSLVNGISSLHFNSITIRDPICLSLIPCKALVSEIDKLKDDNDLYKKIVDESLVIIEEQKEVIRNIKQQVNIKIEPEVQKEVKKKEEKTTGFWSYLFGSNVDNVDKCEDEEDIKLEHSKLDNRDWNIVKVWDSDPDYNKYSDCNVELMANRIFMYYDRDKYKRNRCNPERLSTMRLLPKHKVLLYKLMEEDRHLVNEDQLGIFNVGPVSKINFTRPNHIKVVANGCTLFDKKVDYDMILYCSTGKGESKLFLGKTEKYIVFVNDELFPILMKNGKESGNHKFDLILDGLAIKNNEFTSRLLQ